jgi:A/G-specific adenine glycosylase
MVHPMTINRQDFSRRLIQWYRRARRDLPWRIEQADRGFPDPYHVLVSELMLQQTQVATVIPYFHRFLARFPRLADLAGAPEQEVLRLWQGLGYYSRARNLQRAAQQVVAEHAGSVPSAVDALLRLPGIGRYTAGAVASIAYGERAPILDGNVARVLCRVDAITENPQEPKVRERLWQRAEELLPSKQVGTFNSALMELGATICTPRNPKCLLCPVQAHCLARAKGLQEQIPQKKKSKPTPLEKRQVLCIRHGDHWLIEQRPAKGRWAGMWLFITRPADSTSEWPVKISGRPKSLGEIEHQLTHRRYEFVVSWAEAGKAGADLRASDTLVWSTLAGLTQYPLPRPHLRIAEMLQAIK